MISETEASKAKIIKGFLEMKRGNFSIPLLRGYLAWKPSPNPGETLVMNAWRAFSLVARQQETPTHLTTQ